MMGIGAHGAALEINRLTRWSKETQIARGLLIVAIVGGLFMLVAPWQQTAQGQGEVIAFSPNERALALQAPIEGRVAEWYAIEGDYVEAGAVVVRLADNDPLAVARYQRQEEAMERRLEAARTAVAARIKRLASLERVRVRAIAAAQAAVRGARRKAEAVALELEAMEARAHTAQIQVARARLLYEQGLKSRRDFELARRDALEATAGEEEAEARLGTAQADLLAKQADLASTRHEQTARLAEAQDGLQAARAKAAEAEAALADAARALARQRSLRVKAPRSGMLTRVRAREGSAFVKQGEVLAELVPEAQQRAVELFIEGNDAPLVVPGQPVRLQFEGWPAIQFGGWPKAAVGTFTGTIAFVSAQATNGRFRVVVVPAEKSDWPDDEVLRQGNRANGWVLLDTVPLAYELWRQLNGFPPNLPKEAQKKAGVGV